MMKATDAREIYKASPALKLEPSNDNERRIVNLYLQDITDKIRVAAAGGEPQLVYDFLARESSSTVYRKLQIDPVDSFLMKLDIVRIIKPLVIAEMRRNDFCVICNRDSDVMKSTCIISW